MGVFASEYEQSCSFVQFSARGGALVRAADYRKFNLAQQDAGEALLEDMPNQRTITFALAELLHPDAAGGGFA